MKKHILIVLLTILGLGAFLAQQVAADAPATDEVMVPNPDPVPAAGNGDENAGDEWVEDDDTAYEGEDAAPAESVQTDKEALAIAAHINADFDVEEKQRSTIALVDRGVDYFKKNTLDQACRDFTQTKKFIEGELYLFVYDITGIVMAHGQQSDLVWQNLYKIQDAFGSYFVQDIIKKAKNGGGWVTYQWRGATKLTYVKMVNKNEKSYVIGSGYYPHSKKDAVVSLVKGAVSLFEQVQKAGGAKDEAFSVMSYPLGRFVYGDLYIYALSFDGVIVAQGDIPALMGTNSLDYTDSTGKKANREIIAKLQKTDQGIWVEYTSKNAPKLAYAEKVTDKQGNNYFIACGYYPDADRKATESLVQKGYAYMKRHGESAAQREFTGETQRGFRYGDLYLFVYDMKGLCIAHGGNETYVGQNHWDRVDQDGRAYVRDYIEKIKTVGRGWVDAKLKNSFQSAYVEKVDLGLNTYVIGSVLYPISKSETMILLAKSGASYLNGHTREQAFGQFSTKGSAFMRGDLSVFAFDDTGICFAYGDDPDLIWRNMFNAKDDNGRDWVKLLINKVKGGAGTVTYKLNGMDVIAYVEPVKKDGKSYVIGSSYYK